MGKKWLTKAAHWGRISKWNSIREWWKEKKKGPSLLFHHKTDRRKDGCQGGTTNGKEMGKNDHRDRGKDVTY